MFLGGRHLPGLSVSCHWILEFELFWHMHIEILISVNFELKPPHLSLAASFLTVYSGKAPQYPFPKSRGTDSFHPCTVLVHIQTLTDECLDFVALRYGTIQGCVRSDSYPKREFSFPTFQDPLPSFLSFLPEVQIPSFSF